MLPAIEPQVPDTYRRATNKGDTNTCNKRTLRIHTSRRAFSYPSDSARSVAYRENCPRLAVLNMDQLIGIVAGTVPCPAPSPESHMYVVKDRLPAASEIPLFF